MSYKQHSIVLLGANFETGNMGVNALAVSAIRCVLDRYPDANISLLEYAKHASTRMLRVNGRPVEISLVNMRFSKRFYLTNNIAMLLIFALAARLIPSVRWRERFLMRNKCLSAVLEADFIGSIAGGDSFSDIYGLRRVLYVTLPQVLVVLLNRRLLLLPQTIGPFKSTLVRSLARFVMRRAEHIYCREREGVSEVRRLLGACAAVKKCTFCYDMAFVLEPRAPSQLQIAGLGEGLDEKNEVVGLNVSGLLYIGGYNRNNMFGLRADYRELIERVIHLLISECGCSVVLVPHVFGDKADSESDVAACNRVYNTLGGQYGSRLGVIRGNYTESEIKYAIGQFDFFIGSRMHACIAALSQCVPSVAIAYSDKFVGTLQCASPEPVVVDARTMDLETLLQEIRTCFSNRERTRARLQCSIPAVRQAVLESFPVLAA
jgi:polysaccharide pyruvyl transferase WcaK-like protein